MKKWIMAAAGIVMNLTASAGVIFSSDFNSATQAGGVGTVITMSGATNGVTVSTLTAGAGVVSFQIDSISLAGQSVPPVFASDSVGTNPSSNLTQAVANNEYFQFTVSSSNALRYGVLSFTMVKNGFGNFSGITLRSSADNYASDLVTVANSVAQGVYPASVDLSSIAAFGNRTNVTFRFYLYDEYAGNNNRHLGIDNIQIQIAGGAVSGPPVLTISAGPGKVTIGATNLSAVTANTLQFKPYLTYGSWSNLYSVTGVTATNWIFSPTNTGFFRVATSSARIFSVDTYYDAADGTDWGPSIRRAVAVAQAFTAQSKTNFSQVWFTPNATYSLANRTNTFAQIELFQAERISFIGNQARLVSDIHNNHFSLWRCNDITIDGFRLDLNPLPFTQGSVVGVTSASGQFDLQIDSGFAYPPMGTYSTGGGVNDAPFFNPDGSHNHAWVNISQLTHPAELASNVFRVFVASNNFSTLTNIFVGDRCVLKTLMDYPQTGIPNSYASDGELMSNGGGNIEIRKCDAVTIQNTESYASRAQTVHTFGCSRLSFNNFNIVPAPGTGRLLASNKGAVIPLDTLGPVTLTNCWLESAADDLLNPNDNPLGSLVVISSNVVNVSVDTYPMEQSAGWNLLIVNPATPALKATCRIASVSSVSNSGTDFQLVLDQMVFEPGNSSISSNDWIYVQRLAPVTVANTVFVNSMKKGIISKGPTVVSGCTFSNLNYGIHHYFQGIGSSVGSGPFAYGLQATGNQFSDILTGMVVLYTDGSAAFNVDQQNIVSNNVFDQSADGNGIQAVRMNGLTIENNSFSFDPSVPADRQAIVLVSCTNTIVSGNTGDRLP